MIKKELNLRPMQELLTNEVNLNDLIRYLDTLYYCFTEFSMKTSYFEDMAIVEEAITCRYWIVRLKQVFEEMKSFEP